LTEKRGGFTAVPGGETMVLEYIRYTVSSERAAEFLAAYGAAAEELRASPHCIAFEVSRGIEEPEHFIVRIAWDSVGGHEEGFRKEAGFASFFTKVKPFFQAIQEMKHYEVQQSGKGKQP
jgi:quinol monooxygenase YgiN